MPVNIDLVLTISCVNELSILVDLKHLVSY